MISWLLETWRRYREHRVSRTWLDNQQRVEHGTPPEQICWTWPVKR